MLPFIERAVLQNVLYLQCYNSIQLIPWIGGFVESGPLQNVHYSILYAEVLFKGFKAKYSEADAKNISKYSFKKFNVAMLN